MIAKISQVIRENKFLNPSPLRFDDDGLISHGKVWRSDTRTLKELKLADGFQSSGSDTNLQLHVRAYSSSAYIGFGSSLLDATKFCRPVSFKMKPPFIGIGSYLYKTTQPKIYVDVRKSYAIYTSAPDRFIGHNYAEVENEIAAFHSMPYIDIYKGRRYVALPGLGVPFCFVGELLNNPDYQPRNWAISIPSASSEEADYLEKQCRGTALLRKDQRFIHLPEAEEISAALQKEASIYKLPNDPQMFIFDKLPIRINEKQSVNYVVEQYHKDTRAYVDASKRMFSFFSKQENISEDLKSNDSTKVAEKKP